MGSGGVDAGRGRVREAPGRQGQQELVTSHLASGCHCREHGKLQADSQLYISSQKEESQKRKYSGSIKRVGGV